MLTLLAYNAQDFINHFRQEIKLILHLVLSKLYPYPMHSLGSIAIMFDQETDYTALQAKIQYHRVKQIREADSGCTDAQNKSQLRRAARLFIAYYCLCFVCSGLDRV
jgi:hypothetical protein